MANAIGMGGFNFPIDNNKKVGFQKAAPASQEKAQQLPGDVSDINFSFSTPAAAPKAETFVQTKAVPVEAAPVKSYTAPSGVTNHGIMDLSVGEIGANLLGSSKESGGADFVNSTMSFIANGKLTGFSGKEYQASFS